jgi:hypothetical protein
VIAVCSRRFHCDTQKREENTKRDNTDVRQKRAEASLSLGKGLCTSNKGATATTGPLAERCNQGVKKRQEKINI